MCVCERERERERVRDREEIRTSHTPGEWLTCVNLCLIGRDRSEVAKIALVANKHDDDVGVSMVTEFFQPSLHILVCEVLGNVVDQQRPHCSSVVTEHRLTQP